MLVLVLVVCSGGVVVRACCLGFAVAFVIWVLLCLVGLHGCRLFVCWRLLRLIVLVFLFSLCLFKYFLFGWLVCDLTLRGW